MTDPHSIIVQTLRFDHDPTAEARRVLEAFDRAGLEVVPKRDRTRLPEVERVYAKTGGQQT